MFRFYVKEKDGDRFILSNETRNHIKVARATKKEFICVHEGKFYISRLEGDQALIIEELQEFHDFDNEVIVAAGFINIKKFEWLIQKATELGATKLIPIISENISTKLPRDLDKKLERWNEIAFNASEQSFRNYQMIVEKPMELRDALKLNVKYKFIAHEKDDSIPPDTLPTNSMFFVGPEGGFSEYEIDLAQKCDAKVISLGKRILRAETASIFMLSRVK